MYLLLCLYLLIISVRLFKMLSCLYSAIANFSFRHNMHHFVAVLCDWCISRISHSISSFLPRPFSFQISFGSSVSVLYFLFLKIFDGLRIVTWTWFHWCCSKFFLKFFAVDVIFVLYKTLLLRHLLYKGHLDLLI